MDGSRHLRSSRNHGWRDAASGELDAAIRETCRSRCARCGLVVSYGYFGVRGGFRKRFVRDGKTVSEAALGGPVPPCGG